MQSNEKLREALGPISWLSGRWIAYNAKGHYPTIKDFTYEEELIFSCIGQPMFNYISTSKRPGSRTPMHQDRGFLRIKPGTNDVTLLVAHNFGLVTVEEGQCDPEKKEITLKSASITRTQFSKPPYVKSFERKIRLINIDTLEVIFFLETESTPLSEHLNSIYTKVPNDVVF